MQLNMMSKRNNKINIYKKNYVTKQYKIFSKIYDQQSISEDVVNLYH